MMKVVFFVVFLFALLEQLNAENVFDGRPNEGYTVAVFAAQNKDKCLTEAWKKKDANAGAFCSTTKECRAYALPELLRNCLIERRPSSILKQTDPCWKTYLKSEQKDWKPIIYWMLDKESKGKNLVDSDHNMPDLPTTGKCDFDSSGQGPGPLNTSLFCSSQQKSSLIPLTVGDKLLFDFTQAFEISMWIKTSENCATQQTLIGSEPTSASRFLMSPSANCDQLAFGFSDISAEHAITTLNGEDKEHWRHFVVIYKPPTTVKFLRYGREWPLKRKLPKLVVYKRSDQLSVFAGRDNDMPLSGHVAGISFMQKPTT